MMKKNKPESACEKDAEIKEEVKEQTPQSQSQSQCDAAEAKKEQPSKEQEYYEQLLRLKADYENYRKRAEREKSLFIEFGRIDIIKKILPLYDVLLKAENEVNKENAGITQIQKGLNMIFDGFDKFFQSEGIKALSAEGQAFDCAAHEVITTAPCHAEQDGKVVREICRAITLNGKVIRPAQVIVGKKSQEDPVNQEERQNEK
jgi:molecular chaperone GrpE